MSSNTSTLNNKEIVSRALDIVTDKMQNKIITVMTYEYGQSWWQERIVSQRVTLGIQRQLPDTDYVDTDFAKECMDTQLCCKLMRREKGLFFPLNYSAVSRLLTNVQDIRNEKSHTGKMTYSVGESKQALDDLMAFADAMEMDIDGDLSDLKKLIQEEVKRPDVDFSPVDAVPKRDVPSVVRCDKVPKGSLLDIGQVCVNSCIGFYDAITELQRDDSKTSRSISSVKYVVKGDAYILTIDDEKLNVDDSTGVIVDGVDYGYGAVSFEGFDRGSHKVKMYPSPAVADRIREDSKIELYSDMRWLVSRTQEFFETYGYKISYPPRPTTFAPSSKLSKRYADMTSEQEEAVNLIMGSPLSYVWGVPGSGKTRYVLATAINECLRRGERVAVIAPTNYALEQVLTGLLDAFENDKDCKVDPEKDIVRVGTPTAEFLKAHPSACERRGIQAALQAKQARRVSLNIAIAEKRYPVVEPKVKEALTFISAASKTSAGPGKLLKMMKPLLDVMRADPRYSVIASGISERNVVGDAKRVYDLIYNRDRSSIVDEELLSRSEDELVSQRDEVLRDIKKLTSEDAKADINSCKVVAMTLSKFIMSFGPDSVNARSGLNVDHVFVDEAGYCNCIQVSTLFSLGAPVTLLGDHKQLPPVCEVESRVLKANVGTDDHGYDYLWELSGLYVDGLFAETLDGLADRYRNDEDPGFEFTSVARLFTTHRFGQNLADALGKTVYGSDIDSGAKDPLDIVVIDAYIDRFPANGERVMRKNISEARKVVEFVKKNNLNPNSYVVLTPYRDQQYCLRSEGRGVIPKDNVSTIHRSQGKEWDTVIISVCDGRACGEDKPPRFTSTAVKGSIGSKVINTAVSRAKKRLVIVCDTDYWRGKIGELLSEILSN